MHWCDTRPLTCPYRKRMQCALIIRRLCHLHAFSFFSSPHCLGGPQIGRTRLSIGCSFLCVVPEFPWKSIVRHCSWPSLPTRHGARKRRQRSKRLYYLACRRLDRRAYATCVRREGSSAESLDLPHLRLLAVFPLGFLLEVEKNELSIPGHECTLSEPAWTAGESNELATRHWHDLFSHPYPRILPSSSSSSCWA